MLLAGILYILPHQRPGYSGPGARLAEGAGKLCSWGAKPFLSPQHLLAHVCSGGALISAARIF